MGKFLKQLTAVAFSLILTVAGLVPLTRVYATEYGSGNYGLTVGVDENQDWVKDLTVNGAQWTSDDDEFLTSDGKYAFTIELEIPNDEVKDNVSVRTSGDVSEYFEIRSAGDPEDLHNDKTKFTYTANYDMQSTGHTRLSLFPFAEENHGGEEPVGDFTAHLLVACDETGEARCEDVSFMINDGRPEPYRGENEDIEYRYDGDEEDVAIRLRVATLWHQKITHLLVNDAEVEIPIDYSDQKSYLDHYDHQIVSFELPVPKAEDGNYNIAVSVAINETMHIGNFLWTADPEQKYERDCRFDDESGEDVCEYLRDEEGNLIPGRNYIGNASIAPVAVSYTLDGITYACDLDSASCTKSDAETGEGLSGCSLEEDEKCGIPHVEFDSGSEEYDDGSLVVPAGARITMRVIPDYGYQVLNVNMADLVTNDEGVGEFTFTVPGGAAYFVADVVEMKDFVSADAEGVAAGTINLGNDELEHGTAQLSVSDVDLDGEDITGFEEAAEGYNISNYLEISLYNIVCKGRETCNGTIDDSWRTQIDDLEGEATITLQLEEGVDGNEVVIVHQKHDGTYEVIPTTYDPETNTITFTTSSFSNYAIASRTVATPDTGSFTRESSHVKEGASVAAFILMLGFVLVSRKKIATRK